MMIKQTTLRGLMGVAAGFALWGFAAVGQAASLDLVRNTTLSDFDVSPVVAAYAPGAPGSSGLFSASNPDNPFGVFNYVHTAAGNTGTAYLGSYDLVAHIYSNGALDTAQSNTVTLTADDGNGPVTLAGNISQFGFSNDVYEFVVDITQSPAGLGFGGVGAKFGIIMTRLNSSSFGNSNPTPFAGSASFANLAVDNFVLASVPEPSVLALLGMGVLVARRYSRRDSAEA